MSRFRGTLLVAGLLAGTTWAGAGDAESIISGRARVVNGGTIAIGARVFSIDGVSAPDPGRTCQEWRGRKQASYACGIHAKAFLSSLVDGRRIFCVQTAKARQGVAAARCYSDGRDLGEALVNAGWATANTGSRRYIAAQESARAAQRGMWAGSFEPGRPAKGGLGIKIR